MVNVQASVLEDTKMFGEKTPVLSPTVRTRAQFSQSMLDFPSIVLSCATLTQVRLKCDRKEGKI